MSNVAGGIMVEENTLKGKPTLVRRVSAMLKDGNYSGPPMLFRHASMQKIRHCCQNLNLFPYLLYSFDNSKSHPISRKVHLCLNHFLRGITARIFFLYKSLRRSVFRGVQEKEEAISSSPLPSSSIPNFDGRIDESPELVKPSHEFKKFERRRPKQPSSLFLTLAVYFAPLLIAFQLIGLCGLMVLGKYTPGFVFLFTALMFLGCIAMKVLSYADDARQICHGGSRSEKKKVQ